MRHMITLRAGASVYWRKARTFRLTRANTNVGGLGSTKLGGKGARRIERGGGCLHKRTRLDLELSALEGPTKKCGKTKRVPNPRIGTSPEMVFDVTKAREPRARQLIPPEVPAHPQPFFASVSSPKPGERDPGAWPTGRGSSRE